MDSHRAGVSAPKIDPTDATAPEPHFERASTPPLSLPQLRSLLPPYSSSHATLTSIGTRNTSPRSESTEAHIATTSEHQVSPADLLTHPANSCRNWRPPSIFKGAYLVASRNQSATHGSMLEVGGADRVTSTCSACECQSSARSSSYHLVHVIGPYQQVSLEFTRPLSRSLLNSLVSLRAVHCHSTPSVISSCDRPVHWSLR